MKKSNIIILTIIVSVLIGIGVWFAWGWKTKADSADLENFRSRVTNYAEFKEENGVFPSDCIAFYSQEACKSLLEISLQKRLLIKESNLTNGYLEYLNGKSEKSPKCDMSNDEICKSVYSKFSKLVIAKDTKTNPFPTPTPSK